MNILLCPMSDPGFLYPVLAIGRELRRRGHVVHVLGAQAAGAAVAEAGFGLLPAAGYGAPESFDVARWFLEAAGQRAAVARAAREVAADALLTSVLCPGALLAAEALELPVVVVGLAAYLWDYPAGGEGEPDRPAARAWRTRDMTERYAVAREQAGLPARPLSARRADFPLLGDAFLVRGDPALEYPGARLPSRVHHVGPCAWEPAADPAELGPLLTRLDQTGKPVVYVHLGRYFGGKSPWPRLNAMFTGGPFQAVVEVGRSRSPAPAPGPDYQVVRKPWLGPLIDRAGLVLSSGTTAPVLAALLRGRPLGLTPEGAEQPLLAQACARFGAARLIPAGPSAEPFAALRECWADGSLRDRAAELGRRLAAAGGPALAAGIVERAAAGRTGPAGRPVLRQPERPAAAAR